MTGKGNEKNTHHIVFGILYAKCNTNPSIKLLYNAQKYCIGDDLNNDSQNR